MKNVLIRRFNENKANMITNRILLRDSPCRKKDIQNLLHHRRLRRESKLSLKMIIRDNKIRHKTINLQLVATKRSAGRKRLARIRLHSVNRMQDIKTKGKKRKNNFKLTSSNRERLTTKSAKSDAELNR